MVSIAFSFVFLAALVAPLTWVVSAEYSDALAMSALYFSKASYCDAAAITSWTCESCNEGAITVKRVYQNDTVGTQAFIGVTADRIVISFRGSSNVLNWIANIDAVRIDHPNKACKGCGIHAGFAASYYVLSADIWRDVQELVRANPKYSILVTGHSLGGAMATLAAADLAAQGYPSGSAPHIELYTFGSPRVGNKAFAEWAAQLFCNGGHSSHRITNKRDAVPHLPTMSMGFLHLGREYWFEGGSAYGYKECNDVTCDSGNGLSVTEDDTCSNSLDLPVSTPDHLQYLGTCTSCSCKFEALFTDAVNVDKK